MNAAINARGILRFLAMVFLLCAFVLESFFFAALGASRYILAKCAQRYAKRMLFVLQIRTQLAGEKLHGPGLLVCNHISYIDILVIAATHPALFITSVEVQNAGWIGLICKVAGCVFVDRRKVSGLAKEMHDLEEAIHSGAPLVLFPEATSSSGEGVLPFRSSLFECAVKAELPVYSLCIRYSPSAAGIAYYGDMQLLPHLFALCQRKMPTRALLSSIGKLDSRDLPERKMLAKKSYEMIHAAYVSGT